MDMYQAIADPTRRRILEVIALNGKASASEISNKFNITPPAISQHLKILREAKIVDMEKRAQQRIYTINSDKITEIEQWIQKVKKMWEGKFDRLDELLKKEKGKLKNTERR